MEESYQVAVRRETVQNIRSYSFELNYLLLGHATAFQGTVWVGEVFLSVFLFVCFVFWKAYES